jgi:phospholipid/cholesterol/gamma-HCH transport system substrate-binding protein
MEPKVNYTLVGAFMLFLIAATILAIIWLSSGFSFEQFTVYKIYMQESVSGLNIDSPVEYNGVNVGSVLKVDLNPKNPHEVELLLNINKSTPITKGTVATLNTRGVTGITFIALKDDSTDLTPLRASRDQPYPVIKTAPSFFLRLDTALSKLSYNLEKVSDSIQGLLDKDNQQSIKDILTNMSQVTGTLAANSQKLNTILENTAKASAQFGPLVQSSAGSMRILETQTLPATYKMISNLNEMTRSMAEISQQIKQNPAVLVRGVEHQPLGPGEAR